MVAHGHVEMIQKTLKNYGGTWTCRDDIENAEKYGGIWTCRDGN